MLAGCTCSWTVSLVVIAVMPLMVAGNAVQALALAGGDRTESAALNQANQVPWVAVMHILVLALGSVSCPSGCMQVASEAVCSMRTVAAFSMQDELTASYSSSIAASASPKTAGIAGLGFGFR